LLGRTLAKNIEFESAIPIASESGARWLRMVSWVYDCLSLDDELSPLMSAQLESGLVHMLLTNQPHNYSAEILADAPSLAPSFVKRVERYIEDHAHEPITIIDMAEHAGVSSRSLFAGFRRYRDTSPMLYLKEIRLRRVNEELLRLSSATKRSPRLPFAGGSITWGTSRRITNAVSAKALLQPWRVERAVIRQALHLSCAARIGETVSGSSVFLEVLRMIATAPHRARRSC